MHIQINDPDEVGSDNLFEFIERSVNESLAPLAPRLTRIEVHLKDLNAKKGGIDKHCLIEARPRGLDPLVAHHDAAQVSEAFRTALDKLKRVLEHRFDKLASRDRP